MGKIKEYILVIAELIEELYEEGITDDKIDIAIQEDLNSDQYYFYMENRDFILEMAKKIYAYQNESNEDEEWIDPAGGKHYGNEIDGAAQYEQLIPTLDEFLNENNKR